MTQEVAYRFIEALAALEERGEIDPILDTFDEACEIGNSQHPEKLHGKDGAREYWTNYGASFRDMRSTFCNIITGDTSIALEWTTRATDRSGKEFQYDGVSILDTRGTAIIRFRAFFDPKKVAERILPQQAHQSVPEKTGTAASSAA